MTKEQAEFIKRRLETIIYASIQISTGNHEKIKTYRPIKAKAEKEIESIGFSFGNILKESERNLINAAKTLLSDYSVETLYSAAMSDPNDTNCARETVNNFKALKQAIKDMERE